MTRTHLPQTQPFRWDGVPVLAYKPNGTHFRDVTRQVLFDGAGIGCELRYFEIEPGGWSSLERHEHVHAVLVLRGEGQALVGREVIDLAEHDLVHVPPGTWHQFRATRGVPLGFLCLVDCARDRPVRPDDAALAELRADPVVADFVRV
ncbi:MAG TPA: cupin domain-containing protein [Gemmatimonadales bacterium]|nr:cupin domain-containing protein [Gemmatimonadales bacterium]